MGNKEILRIAKKVKKDLKGKTDFLSIEDYLEKEHNYTVVFYNTPNGDKLLRKYDLWEDAQDIQAFTYLSCARLVFINGDVSAEDKRLLLCHELGHIALGHMDAKRLIRNKMLLEMEAEAFTNYLINDNTKDCKATVLLCALASAGAVIGTMLLKKAVKADV